jgi:hypothetical protein
MIIRNKKTGEIKEVSMNELDQYGLGGNIYKSGGEMIKRADGSYSRRGLWDNIRANAGSGKRPTKEMLNQERKIKNQHQAEYGMEVMGNGGVPNNPGFNALPEYVQQNIINNMAVGGQKMPPELAYARFAAAGNLDQLNNYGYQIGGEIPTVQGTFKKQNKYGYWVTDEEALAKEAQRLNSKKVLTEGGSLIIFDDNWNIVAADDNPNEPYKQGGSVTLNTGGENHRIYVKTTNRGEGAKGHIMVNHPTMDKGMWDTIDLTEKSGATTIAQGVAATKKWHRENPYMKEYGGDVPMFGPGGFVAKPTVSDSLLLYNNQMAKDKFYKNNPNYKKVGTSYTQNKHIPDIIKFLPNAQISDEILNDMNKHFKTNKSKKELQKRFGKITDNVYSAGDLRYGFANTYFNPNSPPSYFSNTILPRKWESYDWTNNVFNDQAEIPMYDPIAVKPSHMKTEDDWAYMKKTYGTKPPAKINNIPVRTKNNLKKLEIVTRPLTIPKVIPHGELIPVTKMQLKQQGTIPFYGPGNTIIGYTDDNRQFYPLQYSGAPNNQLNLQDKELLANPEMLQKFVQSKDNYKFAEGGEEKERKWYYPKEEITNERPYYDPPTETLYLNPNYNNEPEIVRQHELFHHLQKINGGAQRPEYYTGPLKEPNMMMNEDLQGAYWNRKTVDVNNLMDQVISKNPDFKFYPKDLFYNKVIDGLEYETPGTLENEAQQYEDYIRSGGTPMFNNGGGIPERYRNMGFTSVGAKKQSTRPGKKWMVLAKKGDDYKVVHGGYKGMQDFKQHHSEQRKENFWNRMGGRNSSKATDPFSPLYWHKRFGTWEYGGQPMAIGGQNMMNPIVKKDNRNWLEYLKN